MRIRIINNNNFISPALEIFGSNILIAFSFIKDITNTVNVAKIEDKEEYLKIKVIVIQVNINNNVKLLDNANKIPKKVATPFPPLNFSHIGKRWPRKTINADKSIDSG